MDIQLQVFSAVAELRNFSRAGERLHMTQPAVSQHIRALEEAMGVRLLERNNKSVTLTRAGEIVLHHAREINGLYARMREMVDELVGSAHGPLAVGASYTFGEYMLPLALARLHEAYPDIAPSISIANTADIADRLRQRELDVGIVEGEEIGTGLEAFRLAEDEMVIAAGRHHPLASETSPVSSERLAAEPWMVREAGSGTRAATEGMFAAWGIRPARLMELGSTQLIKETVEAGLGLTLQSRWALRKELGLGSLRLVPAAGLPVRRSFHVLLRKGDLRTRAMDAFLETLRAETGKLLAGGEETDR